MLLTSSGVLSLKTKLLVMASTVCRVMTPSREEESQMLVYVSCATTISLPILLLRAQVICVQPHLMVGHFSVNLSKLVLSLNLLACMYSVLSSVMAYCSGMSGKAEQTVVHLLRCLAQKGCKQNWQVCFSSAMTDWKRKKFR